jgi:hypothetical protein
MLYVLALDHGKFYVGLSNRKNGWSRIQEHFHGRSGCSWTLLHPPRQVILTLSVGGYSTEEEENVLTLRIMHIYGWTNVRGGRWCTPTMVRPPILSSSVSGCFKCQSTEHTSRQCDAKGTMPSIRCFRCNELGHLLQFCPNPIRCFKCDQTGHYQRDCTSLAKCFQCGQSGHMTRTCSNAVKCFHCHQTGHMMSLCPNMK